MKETHMILLIIFLDAFACFGMTITHSEDNEEGLQPMSRKRKNYKESILNRFDFQPVTERGLLDSLRRHPDDEDESESMAPRLDIFSSIKAAFRDSGINSPQNRAANVQKPKSSGYQRRALEDDGYEITAEEIKNPNNKFSKRKNPKPVFGKEKKRKIRKPTFVVRRRSFRQPKPEYTEYRKDGETVRQGQQKDREELEKTNHGFDEGSDINVNVVLRVIEELLDLEDLVVQPPRGASTRGTKQRAAGERRKILGTIGKIVGKRKGQRSSSNRETYDTLSVMMDVRKIQEIGKLMDLGEKVDVNAILKIGDIIDFSRVAAIGEAAEAKWSSPQKRRANLISTSSTKNALDMLV